MSDVSLDRIADALGMNAKEQTDAHEYATVMSINADGSFAVRFNGAAENTRAAALCGAAVGDRVLCIIHDGQTAAVGRVGGCLPLSGGTMSGKIMRQSNVLDLTAANNGLTTYWNPVAFHIKDKNENAMGYLQWYAHNTGYAYVALDARNRGTGSQVTNQLVLRVNNDGTRVVAVSEQKPWRTAINAAEKPTQLYNNASGTTGTVTLSSSAANFNHIRIYYGYETYARTSADVYDPNGKQISLFINQAYDAQYQTYQVTNAVANGTSITQGSKGHFDINFNGGGAYGYVQTSSIRIYRVEGWND